MNISFVGAGKVAVKLEELLSDAGHSGQTWSSIPCKTMNGAYNFSLGLR